MTLNQVYGIRSPQGYVEGVWWGLEGVWKVSEQGMLGIQMVSRQYKDGF